MSSAPWFPTPWPIYRMYRRLLEILLASACMPALAQTGNAIAEKTVRIVRADAAPVIDGVLDEEIWSLAQPIGDFHQIEPNEYDEATEATRVFLLYDDTHLYIGARLLDSRPGEITAQILRQGSDVEDDDYFGVILDPFLDRRNGYLFQLNPNGVRGEALYRNTTQRNFDWVGHLAGTGRDSRGRVDGGDGHDRSRPCPSTPIAIAGESISHGGLPATTRTSAGCPGPASRTRASPARWWVSRGWSKASGLDIVPSLSARESRYFVPSGSDSTTEPSVDVFYKFTPPR